MNEQKCRVCGCTETTPCVTEEGACHWVEPDLCSACADAQSPETGRPGFKLRAEDLVALRRCPEIGLAMDAATAFQILAALQLAARHPGMSASILATVLAVGKGLEQRLALTPNLARLCAAGWQAGHDVAALERPRIILPGEDR